eukprot:SAG31_NODE_302_length_18087_cov_97.056982_19_plen_299_part_00
MLRPLQSATLWSSVLNVAAAMVSLPVEMYGHHDSQTDLHFFGDYYTWIRVGNPGRIYRVQLDTGSATLVLPGPVFHTLPNQRTYDPTRSTSAEPIGCLSDICAGSCTDEACRSDLGALCVVANHTNKTGRRCCTEDSGCFFLQAYADHTAAGGALFSDVISFALPHEAAFEAEAPLPDTHAQQRQGRVVVGQARSLDGLWQPDGIDGMLGIGYSWLNCHPTCTDSPMAALLAQAKRRVDSSISESAEHSTSGMRNVFGLCLQGLLGKVLHLDILHAEFVFLNDMPCALHCARSEVPGT